jgi:hypothetical protein
MSLIHPSIRRLVHSRPYFSPITPLTSTFLRLLENWIVEFLCELDYLRSQQVLTSEQENFLSNLINTAKLDYDKLSQQYYDTLSTK